MITRADYMRRSGEAFRANERDREARDAATMAEHRAYYAQLVNAATINHVVSRIGADRLKASTDQHLNDIALQMWDDVGQYMPRACSFKDLEQVGGVSKSDLVCVAKEAARQWLDAQS